MTDVRSLEEWHERRIEADGDEFDVNNQYVVVDFEGETYAVVAEIIAQMRAAENMPAEDLELEEWSKIYHDLCEEALSDEELLVEWLRTEVDWQDIERNVVRIRSDEPPLSEQLSTTAEIDVRTLQLDTDRNGDDPDV